jgi:hypothetical protein
VHTIQDPGLNGRPLLCTFLAVNCAGNSFSQHHTALRQQLTSSTKVFFHTYFSDGLKYYFKKVLLCCDTTSFVHSIKTLILNSDFHIKTCLPFSQRLYDKRLVPGQGKFFFSPNICRVALRPTQLQEDISSSSVQKQLHHSTVYLCQSILMHKL